MTNHRPLTFPTFLNPREAADYLGTTYEALAEARRTGRGPTFLPIGNNIRYRLDHLHEYAAAAQSDGWMTAAEVAAIVGVSEWTLVELSERGEFIKGQAQGRTRKYRTAQVMRYLAGPPRPPRRA